MNNGSKGTYQSYSKSVSEQNLIAEAGGGTISL